MNASELLALPEWSDWEDIVVDTPELVERHGVPLGTTVRRYKVSALGPLGIAGDDIFLCLDADGNAWRPTCRDGVWYKERVWL